MIHPTWTVSETQAEETPTTAQSDEWQALSKALQALEIAERNRQDYDQLASELTHLVQTLQAHLPDSKPKRMPYSIENVARAIGEQVAHIKQQQGRSGLDQALRASDNESSIIKCYRMIENIFRQLQIDISLSIWDLTHDQWVVRVVQKSS
ncbi:unnamed protein product [Rhizoctonia solani]|uniref:Uncharacterized protein n=1 Tax=Rhizoctonia solani TaxID=456999 RepID=A0A8H2WTN4_9AGAM|nr:unnamed protein product [Rhizoctonia solani]